MAWVSRINADDTITPFIAIIRNFHYKQLAVAFNYFPSNVSSVFCAVQRNLIVHVTLNMRKQLLFQLIYSHITYMLMAKQFFRLNYNYIFLVSFLVYVYVCHFVCGFFLSLSLSSFYSFCFHFHFHCTNAIHIPHKVLHKIPNKIKATFFIHVNIKKMFS